jgi:WD40 repeat protein
MSRIFISHSSRDDKRAIEVRDWLVANGWDDVFLDLDPVRGLAPGERWQNALKAAADRCEAVLFLISLNWLNSRWCLSEYLLAKQLGKRLFPVLIGEVGVAALPADMAADHQAVDLASDPQGWERLKQGLRRAGLDANSFSFPAGRRPYPGFEPLTEEDAAIFFGRDAQVLRGLDRLRLMRDTGAERVLAVLGASGAGKSSFLRAGLWPRLRRDDRNFWPLPVIRPERAGLTGRAGLYAALEGALTDQRLAGCPAITSFPRSRSALGEFVTREGLARLFIAIRLATAAALGDDSSASPALVLCIDQAEELLSEEGTTEAERFLNLLAKAFEADRHLLAIMSIRSDAYPRLQAMPSLAGLAREPFDLPPIPQASLRSVIEGPARLVTPPLKLEPAFVDAVLEDATGHDALPLLAFTLNRLMREHGADGVLTLQHYTKSGGVRGAVTAAVEEALDEGRRRGLVPKDDKSLEALLGQAFVPHLARVNDVGTFVRRTASVDEIPAAARGLVDLLVEARLLTRHRGEQREVIEVAHEALLREWPLLRQFLEADREFLVGKRQLADDVAIWEAAPPERKVDALLSGLRLTRAQQWLTERASHEFTPTERSFVGESVRAAQARQRWLTRMAAAVILLLAGFSAVAAWQWIRATRTAAFAEQEKMRAEQNAAEAERNAGVAAQQTREAEAQLARSQRNESRALAERSLNSIESNDLIAAMRYALEALPNDFSSPNRPLVRRAEFALSKSLLLNRLKFPLAPSKDWVNTVALGPNGKVAATGTRDGLLSIWNLETGDLVKTFNTGRRAVFRVAFSPDGKLVASSHQDPNSIVVRDVETGHIVCDLKVNTDYSILRIFFAPSISTLITVGNSFEARPRLWSLESCRMAGTFDLLNSSSVATAVAMRDDERFLALATTNRPESSAFYLWDLPTRKLVFTNAKDAEGQSTLDLSNFEKEFEKENDFEKGEEIRSVAFNKTNELVLLGKRTVYLIDLVARKIKKRWQVTEDDHRNRPNILLVTRDGNRIVVPISDSDLAVYDSVGGNRVATLRGGVSKLISAVISPNQRLVAGAAEDLSIRIWDIATGNQVLLLRGHTERLSGLLFSKDGHELISYGDNPARVWDVREDEQRAAAGPGVEWKVQLVTRSGSDALVARVRNSKTEAGKADEVESLGLWNFEKRKLVREIDSSAVLRPDLRHTLFSPDGTRILFVRSYTASDEKRTDPLVQKELEELAASYHLPIAALSAGATLFELANVESGKTEHSLMVPTKTEGDVNLVLSADGSMLGIISEIYGSEDADTMSYFQIWDIADGKVNLEISAWSISEALLRAG